MAQPRQRFTFKKVATQSLPSQQVPEPLPAKAREEALPASPVSLAVSGTPEPPFSDPASSSDTVRRPEFATPTIAIANQSTEHIIPDASSFDSAKTAIIANIRSSIVALPAGPPAQPLSTLTITDASNSVFICGAVDGAVHLTGLNGCVVAVSARQFRMHESTGVDVYLDVTSQPIIEDCKGLRLAPLPVQLTAKADGTKRPNLWDQVLDFNFLGKPGESPNWRKLSEHEGLKESLWQELQSCGSSLTRDEMIKAACSPIAASDP